MSAVLKRKSNSNVKAVKKSKSRSEKPVTKVPKVAPRPKLNLVEEDPDSDSESIASVESGSDSDELDDIDDEAEEDEIALEDGDDLESNLDDNVENGSVASHTGSSDARAQRQEKKRLAKERKLKKSHGQEIEQVKQIWERLREKSGVPRAERDKLLAEVMKLVDGHWRDVVFRHDSTRVVQTVFKYADKALRHEITVALKGTYVSLAKSAYGKYLLVKMMHYGSPKVRSDIINELHGSFRKLMGHKEGAYVLEDCYREFATAKQRRQIMREFFGSEYAVFKEAGDDKANLAEIIAAQPDKRPFLLENLNKVITQAVGKGSIGFEVVHAMMLEYIRNVDRSPKSMDRETFIDLIADDFVELVHTNAGSQVASLALACSTSKERKRLLKSLRQFPLKLAQDNFGNFVLMSSFMTVDDTKMTHKAFHELEEHIVEMISDRYARRPFLLLLLGDSNTKYFGVLQQKFKEINEFKQDFSKKDDVARRQELLEAFAPAIRSSIIHGIDTLIKENLGAQFILEFLLNDKARDEETLSAVADIFSSNPDTTKDHPLKVQPISGRMAKTLAANIPEFRSRLLEIVTEYPVQWTTSSGSFAVINLLETLKGEELQNLKTLLKKNLKKISGSDFKGKELLLGLLNADGSAN